MNEKNEQQEKTEQEVHTSSSVNCKVEPLMNLLPGQIKSSLLDDAISELFGLCMSVRCKEFEAETTILRNGVEEKYSLTLKPIKC